MVTAAIRRKLDAMAAAADSMRRGGGRGGLDAMQRRQQRTRCDATVAAADSMRRDGGRGGLDATRRRQQRTRCDAGTEMWQRFGEDERFIHSWHVADEYLVALVVTSVYSPDAAAAVEEPGNRLLASSRAALAAGGGGHGWVPLSHHEQASKTPSRG